jgi:hypothetical protein
MPEPRIYTLASPASLSEMLLSLSLSLSLWNTSGTRIFVAACTNPINRRADDLEKMTQGQMRTSGRNREVHGCLPSELESENRFIIPVPPQRLQPKNPLLKGPFSRT